MRLRALRELPSNGKIAFGSLLFNVDADGVLDPQPTDLQVSTMKLDAYLKWVDRGPAAVESAPVPFKLERRDQTFSVQLSEPKTPNLITPVEDDDDDVFMDVEPQPAPEVVSKLAKEDYSKLTVSELRDLCDVFKLKYASNATKTKLIELLNGV